MLDKRKQDFVAAVRGARSSYQRRSDLVLLLTGISILLFGIFAHPAGEGPIGFLASLIVLALRRRYQ